jgi:NADH:ubiquinone oxidoreductase subunit D
MAQLLCGMKVAGIMVILGSIDIFMGTVDR